MIFEQLNSGACKTYLVASELTKDAILVDPILQNSNEYLNLLKQRGLKLRYILDTHVHADHLSGAAALADQTGADYVMHKNSVAKCANVRVDDGHTLQIGDVTVTLLHTPGHTKDSVSVLVGDKLLTGDFLFLGEGGAGRTDLPGGDSGDHWDALQKLANLPDRLWIHPGHDYHARERSTLGEERTKNDRLARRTRTEYIQWLAGFKLGASDWMVKVIQANYSCTRDPNAVEIPCEGNTCEVKASPAQGGAVREIACESLAKLLTTNRPDLILDVRNPDEYTGELGHIDGARLLPLPDLAARAAEINEFKNKSIITICKMGGRSAKAAQTLAGLGFGDVRSMTGGMARWKSLNMPVVK
ncbi:MAG: MBL fold metallo-hydrolase [Planctomycetes bacterium]|nr:MBL fold metallo-hydrolase [Planctomycetota bacterium]